MSMPGVASLAGLATRMLLRRDNDWDGDDVGENKNCVKAVPGPNGHVPPRHATRTTTSIPNSNRPLLFAHCSVSLLWSISFSWVLIMGGVWETVSFAIHALGSRDQQNQAYASVAQILFLLAPLWINAFVYMSFTRAAWYYHYPPESPRRLLGIPITAMTKIFVWADVLAFLVQAVGGSMASPGASGDIIQKGLTVYLVGMGVQQFFIAIFCIFMIRFNIRQRQGYGYAGKGDWRPLIYALYATLVCITIRIIYRIAEFAGGITPSNPIPFHEEYSYALDVFPMMVALLILAIWHPGRFLTGRDSEIPKVSRKQKKADRRQRKAERKAADLV
ncbi:uncharacterized protein PG998_006067 [Apiospora kogelbergensis]|uniref:uncharacterized protein n=1 Tax=Apiospora kogelbergensis TaxID=1337665 RepID=UPI0031319719